LSLAGTRVTVRPDQRYRSSNRNAASDIVTKRNRSTRSESKKPATPQHPGSRQERNGIALPLALAVLLAVVAYLNALGNAFTLDDVSIIAENPVVRDFDLRSIFTTPYWARGGTPAAAADPTLYRPLTLLSFAADHSVWDLNATAFHSENVALHAATTALVYLLALEVAGGMAAAFVAASLFAVHPIHTEAVTGIVGRADILAALFFVLAFLVLRQRSAFREGNRASTVAARSAAGALLWLAGLLSKEMAATLPLVLAVDDWLHRDELPASRSGAIRVLAVRYAPLALVAFVYFILRQNAVSGGAHIWPGFAGVAPFARVLTASRVMLEYLGLFVFPHTLLADYWTTDVPIARLAQPAVLLSLVLWTTIGVLLFRFGRRHAAFALATAWFFITIAPVSNVLFPIGVAKAERLLYLPSVGLCLLAGWVAARVSMLVPSRPAARLAFAIVLVALTWRTALRNRDWKDNLTLALSTLEDSPSSPLMNDIAAGEFMKRGEAARALPLLRTAVQQAPDLPFLHSHLGAVYYTLQMPDEAIAAYGEAIRLAPFDADALNNLGVAYLDRQLADEALAAFQSAIAARPGFADAHLNLGTLHLALGRLKDAEAEFTEAVRLNPSSAEAHNNLGLVLARMGQVDRAAERYREALRLNPGFAKARANLAALVQRRDSANRRP
jgi:Flp pilus assembly protein TadD